MTDLADDDASELLSQFERDGYVVVPGLIAPETCATLLAVVDRLRLGADDTVVPQHQHGSSGLLKMTKLNQLSDHTEAFAALAHSSKLVDVVEVLIGPRSRVFRDVVVVKPGPTDGVLRHHQDSAYWDVEPKRLVSAWVALSDASAAAGPLSVVPGSHRSLARHDLILGKRMRLPRRVTELLRGLVSRAGTGDNAATTSDGSLMRRLKRSVLANESRLAPLLEGLQDYHVLDVDESACEILSAEVGDVVFFHSLLVHGTGPNLTEHDRVASIMSYMPADARLPNADASALPLARRPAT